MTTIAIVDYGSGNIFSVARALHAAAADARIVLAQTPQAILDADRVVLPGQGAMPDCMAHLDQSGLRDALLTAARNKPLLGICVGEQMLFDSSQEGNVPCLGLIPGQVRRFEGPNYKSSDHASGPGLKVPHIGWNRVHQTQDHPLWAGIEDGAFFYFVHSYFVDPLHIDQTCGSTHYGQRFTSAIANANIFALQCHPEKSADNGLQLFRNFANWKP
ncbi:imidazole glycerol phosphate synthase subunit HisH [Alcaligenes sp. RM2]|uniref:imidazole glycerol phosphate synthase subunit HisH n=1 Tax=Alcaligenes TaxID=507 RepID=UPI0020C56105|nr:MULTISPECIES: imidazole glycerol phosphate synthase subunit HisH [Alcaligenes]UTM03601.1 imidazole glycerol phosphate synthase subunit HisH [Alcaligenes sp. NLF5-7]HRO20309.1 imidazole glycerol phosphate synthase subunit HisH [Alcaligenes phenolicus]HRP14004.1 imidazole glycerol phosphate synthase subunit HisH [Alcaligenes phenolicus]